MFLVMTRRHVLVGGSALTLLAGLLTVHGAGGIAVSATGVGAQMPTQAFYDGTSGVENTASGGIWTDLSGGVAARPYVRSLAVTNDGVTEQVFSDSGVTPPAVATGGLTAVVSPTNLCKSGVTPSPGVCYATPNRVAVTLVRAQGDTSGWDFSTDGADASPRVDADTVVDLTLALNTLGTSLRWSWVNGELVSWQTSNLGREDATVRIRFRPATQPRVMTFPEGNGCTATPVRDCDIAAADDQVLAASLVLSLDQTLDAALTGAVFATENAFSGYLQPAGTSAAPALDIQVASTHLTSTGAPQLGTVQALLPSTALLQLYAIPAADAARAFTTTRAGATGTNGTPTYEVWTAAENGTDGLLVTVRDITFSVPSYRVKSRVPRAASSSSLTATRTALALRGTGCTASRPCSASVYDLGKGTQSRFVAARKPVAKGLAVATKAATLRVARRDLPRGHGYAVVLRRPGTHKLVSTARGTVG